MPLYINLCFGRIIGKSVGCQTGMKVYPDAVIGKMLVRVQPGAFNFKRFAIESILFSPFICVQFNIDMEGIKNTMLYRIIRGETNAFQ